MSTEIIEAGGGEAWIGTAAQIVDDPVEITVGWLTAALRAGGVDAEVVGLRYERIGTGQVGANFRFHLEYADPAAAARRDAPATVVVKMAAGEPAERDVVSHGYRAEVGFYARLAATARIRTPRCWQAAISADHRSFTLVLEDAAPAQPGSQEAGCDARQAADAVRNLAGLHAPFWNSTLLDAESSWLSAGGDEEADFLGDLLVNATVGFVERLGSRLTDEDIATLHASAALTHRWRRSTRTPFSLLHGDYRLDNLLFPPDGPGVLAVDWQTLSIGLPGRDLAYFLSTALTPTLRREQEASLVAAYHERLVELGVSDHSAEDCFTDYRRGMLQGPLITVLGCMYATAQRSDAADRMFVSMAHGACTAIRDLDTLGLIAAS